jgi:hypothetical protein
MACLAPHCQLLAHAFDRGACCRVAPLQHRAPRRPPSACPLLGCARAPDSRCLLRARGPLCPGQGSGPLLRAPSARAGHSAAAGGRAVRTAPCRPAPCRTGPQAPIDVWRALDAARAAQPRSPVPTPINPWRGPLLRPPPPSCIPPHSRAFLLPRPSVSASPAAGRTATPLPLNARNARLLPASGAFSSTPRAPPPRASTLGRAKLQRSSSRSASLPLTCCPHAGRRAAPPHSMRWPQSPPRHSVSTRPPKLV